LTALLLLLPAARGAGADAAEAPGGGRARRPRGARRAAAADGVPAAAAAAGERQPRAQVGVGSRGGRLVVRADAAYARGAAVAAAGVGIGGLAAERRREAAQAPCSRHGRWRRVVAVQLYARVDGYGSWRWWPPGRRGGWYKWKRKWRGSQAMCAPVSGM